MKGRLAVEHWTCEFRRGPPCLKKMASGSLDRKLTHIPQAYILRMCQQLCNFVGSRDGSPKLGNPWTCSHDLLHFSVDFLFGYCFLFVWHSAVFLSLQSFLCSSSTLGCLRAWQFPLHFLVSDLACPHSALCPLPHCIVGQSYHWKVLFFCPRDFSSVFW